MPEQPKQPENVQEVADYALGLVTRKMAAYKLQIEAWDELLEWACSLALLKSQLPALKKLHRGLTLKLDAELEESIVVQRGIEGQVRQMEAAASSIVRPEMFSSNQPNRPG